MFCLTYSGRFTHVSGHPSTTDRAQDRESSPAKDRRSTGVPRNQPWERTVRWAVSVINETSMIERCWWH